MSVKNQSFSMLKMTDAKFLLWDARGLKIQIGLIILMKTTFLNRKILPTQTLSNYPPPLASRLLNTTVSCLSEMREGWSVYIQDIQEHDNPCKLYSHQSVWVMSWIGRVLLRAITPHIIFVLKFAI